MRWRLLVFQSLYTVTLDQTSHFDLPRLLASDAIRQEGTSGFGMDFGSAITAVVPQALPAGPECAGYGDI